mgnify:CR=1 FL=1
MPKRIQRKRTKGFRLQDASPDGLPVVYVGRPSRWGNPFEVDKGVSRQEAKDRFAVHLAAYFGFESRMVAKAFYPWPVQSTALRDWVKPLQGKNLACWCPLVDSKGNRVPCHGDILLEIANASSRISATIGQEKP